ncbi:hypothetical protein BDW71DRAFT_192228 [Aspergillus fruticulosus]
MPRSNGCIPCKLRRKKCDEQKPFCAACIRNVLICAWGDMPEQLAKLSAADVTLRGRSPQTRPSLANRPRTARICRTSSPSSALQSVHELQQQSSIHGLRLSHPQLNHNQSAYLYKFFLHKAAQVVSIWDEPSNSFLHVLVPVAMESDMVLHALLAFSGVVCLRNAAHATVANAVWEQYAQAVRSLKHNLTLYSQGQSDLAILLLVSCLILCALESCNADTHEHAFLHLKAAQNLLIAAHDHCLNAALFSFAAEFYLHHVALLPSASPAHQARTHAQALKRIHRYLTVSNFAAKCSRRTDPRWSGCSVVMHSHFFNGFPRSTKRPRRYMIFSSRAH